MNRKNQNIYFEADEFINEALIKIADNRNQQLFGNIVMFAGGSGSGKGFVIDNLLDIQGKTMDVDKLKSMALRSPVIIKKIENVTQANIKHLDLKNPQHTFLLHQAIKESGLKDQFDILTFATILSQPEERKPNIIFDLTMKDLNDLQAISISMTKLGYKLENIHLIWIVNDIETAKEQNKSRARMVDENILISIHKNVATTLNLITKSANSIRKFFDGKMFIVFNNKASDDVELLRSNLGGFFIKNAKYLQIKNRREDIQKLDDEITKKISEYTKTDFKI